MVDLNPEDEINEDERNVKGLLDTDDPFFDEIDRIVQNRTKHEPRVLREASAQFLKYRNRIKTGAGKGKIEDDIKQARRGRLKKCR